MKENTCSCLGKPWQPSERTTCFLLFPLVSSLLHLTARPQGQIPHRPSARGAPAPPPRVESFTTRCVRGTASRPGLGGSRGAEDLHSSAASDDLATQDQRDAAAAPCTETGKREREREGPGEARSGDPHRDWGLWMDMAWNFRGM